VTRPFNPPSSPRLAERVLLLLFLLSLSLVNPWIHGDGIGYYALARAPLIEHSFDFTHDYQSANAAFREARLNDQGQPLAFFRTVTGHLDNHFSVGPAMLWSPFLLLAHAGVHLARALGSGVAADGFSAPYRLAMAFATCLYGFLGLFLSFQLARKYTSALWALLATITIWWATSLAVYMYFNPSWSHAHSAFVVALFLWYWDRTRGTRSLRQWFLLAVVSGLMLNVYYANAMLLAVLLAEALPQYRNAIRSTNAAPEPATPPASLLFHHLLFVAVTLVCLIPVFLTRLVIYGNPFTSGYIPLRYWLWSSPAFFDVLFSSNHGLIVWTPIVLLSFLGLIFLIRRAPKIGIPFFIGALAFYLFISLYPDWAGISSFGNRFFISLTPLFVVGLAVLLDAASRLFSAAFPFKLLSSALLAAFILWNLGLMFQWGIHLVPARGNVDFPQMISNQFTVVPRSVFSRLRTYVFHRRAMMQQIEEGDRQQRKQFELPD
jgi:hypothetical protein